MMAARGKLRVLMTADTLGGVWTYAMGLARATRGAGVEYTIATMGPGPTDDQLEEASRLSNVRLETSSYKLEWMPEPWADVDAAGEWLLGLERRERPDVVHLNGFCHGAQPWRAPVLSVGHSCCLSWWRAVKGEKPPAMWDEYRGRVQRGIDGAAAFVAPSAAMLDEFRLLYGPLPRGGAIYNGARTGAPVRVAKEPMILAAGRVWDEAKNIRALEHIAPRLPWPVLVAGPAEWPIGDAEVRATHTVGLVPLGRLSRRRLAGLLARAAVYAHPARYEPFGLLPLEAALAGCALVLGDIPSLREIWFDAAAYAQPGDEEHLEAVLRGLIAHPRRRAVLAAAARRRARRYSLKRMGRAYTALYWGMLTGKAERTAAISAASV